MTGEWPKDGSRPHDLSAHLWCNLSGQPEQEAIWQVL
jgi:hypothetical protein